MTYRKTIALTFMLLALVLSTVFFLKIEFPQGISDYLKAAYYTQFGAMAISIELFIAGLYLFKKHSKANFALALFGFTIFLDVFFYLIGFFNSMLPIYAMVLLICCGILALWLSFSNTFNLGRISFIGALGSFILGTLIELYFNYF